MTAFKSTADQHGRSCVWVSAGVLSYHICTRDFKCEDCPLQEALSPRGKRPVAFDPAWPKDRRYTEQYLWVEKLSDQQARIGLTALAAQVLNPVARWQFERDTVPRKGDALVIAATRGGQQPLALPFGVETIAFNPRIEIDPIWPLADPWDSGYLATVEVDDWKSVQASTLGLAEAGAGVQMAHRRIDEALTEAGYKRRAETRSADGGLPVKGLVDAIGTQRYRELLLDIFGPPLDE